MYWIVVHTDDYGPHVIVDSSYEYAHAVYERLAADDECYSVELFRTECVHCTYK